MAPVKSQIALPIWGSCSQGFHGPISAPSSSVAFVAVATFVVTAQMLFAESGPISDQFRDLSGAGKRNGHIVRKEEHDSNQYKFLQGGHWRTGS
jgi:hypothetical protein